MPSAPAPLPIDDYLAHIVDLVRVHRAVVITAAPGAGKTTRVPPALAADGPLLLLQPRRVAARAIARRIADERQWTLGREVGWHVRFDRRSSPDTRVLVVTEGMLTVRLQQDPLLSEFRTIVIDEFHERSIHADLGLTLAREAWRARTDLQLVVMSATLDGSAVSRFLDGCPVVEVPGRSFPLEITYAPQVAFREAVIRAASGSRTVLCFLPGAAEIRRAADSLTAERSLTMPIVPLHGGLDAAAQDAAIRPATGGRVVLATNIAETTLTVPGVSCVIDTGLQKIARYDAARAIDSLELERVSKDSADQRGGRAGRTQAGTVIRLWDARDRLRPHREPEISRVDLTGPVLDVLTWGGDPRTIGWFEPPPSEAVEAALRLLARLGAVDSGGRLTSTGRDLQRIPLHPRLARLLLSAGGSYQAALACALLSDRHFLPAREESTSCDLLAALDQARALPESVHVAARQVLDVARRVLPSAPRIGDDDAFRRAVCTAYPDRVARRRAPRSERVLLASGMGARLARESGVHDPEFLVAVDVRSGSGPAAADAMIRIATGIEREWLTPTDEAIVHRLDADGVVRAARIERYGALTLREHACAADLAQTARLLGDEYIRRGPETDAPLLHRLQFAGITIPFEALVRAAARFATRLDQIDLAAHLPADVQRTLDREAPLTIEVPSGRRVEIAYRDSGAFVAVKLQELFGMIETPLLGVRRTPVTFELLAPNGRPVQVTKDLRSFWQRGYIDVRKELRARYPKHAWPENPLTAKAVRRGR
jgi:ATP-dependent helicase HrpB